MKAQKYYTLVGIYKSEDCKYEIIFGDYDRENVESEKDCPHDNYRCLKIITTSDKQEDIQARVDQENINSGYTKGEWKNTKVEELNNFAIKVCDKCEKPFEDELLSDQLVCNACSIEWTASNQPSKKSTPKVQKCFALVATKKDSDQCEIIFTSKFRTGCVDKSLDTDFGPSAFIAKLSSDTDTYQDGWIKKFNETRNANIKWNKANGY